MGKLWLKHLGNQEEENKTREREQSFLMPQAKNILIRDIPSSMHHG